MKPPKLKGDCRKGTNLSGFPCEQVYLGEDPKAGSQEEDTFSYVKVVPGGNIGGPLVQREAAE